MTGRYARFRDEDLTLRDELAIDRTILANERTLLAYLRSGAALAIAGATMMHFTDTEWFFYIGLVCIPLGIVAVLLGSARFYRVNKRISVLGNCSAQDRN